MKVIFAVAALITCSHLIAQENQLQDDSLTTLEEVTVSANKFPGKTTTTGKVVIVITRNDLEKSGAKDLSQVITEHGGIYINGANSNPGKDKSIFIRGGRVEHSLVTIDGVPLYDASGIGGNFDIRQIPIESVERIEILKGSQGTLYGSDAIAGVINIITRKGKDDKLAGSSSLSYGSFNTFKANATIHGSTKSLDYQAGYGFLNSHGISEAMPPNSTIRFDNDGYRQENAQASLKIKFNSLSISPYIRYSELNGEIDQQGFVDETDYSYTALNTQAGIRNEIQLKKLKINLLYNYNAIDRSYLDDSTGSRNGFYTYSNIGYRSNEHFTEGYLVLPLHAVTITTGVDYRYSGTNINAVNVIPPSPPFSTEAFIERIQQSADSVKQNQIGIYAAINYNLSNGFNLEAGGRYNHHSEYGNNFAYNLNPSFLVNNRWKLFANLSTGYKTPGLYQLFSVYGNSELKPEESIHAEAGAQYFTKDGKLSIRGLYFRRNIEEMMDFVYNSDRFSFMYINQDEQKDKGVEFDAKIKLSETISLKAFYSYVDGEITTIENGKDTSYNNLYRRPATSYGLIMTAGIAKKISVSANLSFTGDRKDLTFDPVTFAPVEITLKNYTLINLFGEYNISKHFQVFVDLRNATNATYSEILGYSAPGFNAYGGARLKF